MDYAEATNPTLWTSFGSTAVVSNTGPASGVGFGLGPSSTTKRWHDYVRLVITGNATVMNFFGTRDAWWSPAVATIPTPLTPGQGGTGVNVPLYTIDAYYLGSTLAAACTAATSAGETLLLTQVWTVASGFTCGAQILVLNGGMIKPASGQTVVIGVQNAPLVKFCDTSSGGHCAINAPIVYPEWWGGTPAATSTDVSASITEAQTSCVDLGGCHLRFTQPSTYWFKKQYMISNETVDCTSGATMELPNSFNGSTDFMWQSNLATDVTSTSPASNIDIGAGCTFNGNRLNQAGGASDGDSIGVAFRGCSYCTVRGTFMNFWTDDIFIAGSGPAATQDAPGVGVVVAIQRATGARRNNLSVICVNGLSFVGNPEFDHAGNDGAQAGTAPEAGIDFEPNDAAQANINISGHFTSHDNGSSAVAGQGVNFFWSASSPFSGVTIDCTCFNNSGSGFLAEAEGAVTDILDGLTVLGTYYANGNLTLAPGGFPAVEIISTSNAVVSAHVTSDAGTVASAVFFGYATNAILAAGTYNGAHSDLRIGLDNSDTATVVELSTAAILANDLVSSLNAGNIAMIGQSGTWTPVLSFGGSSTGITYSTQAGVYTKVGTTVTLTANIVLTSKGAATGTALLSGIPYVPTDKATGVVGYFVNMSGTPSITCFLPTIGGSGMQFGTTNGAGTGVLTVQDSNFTNTSTMILTISYHAKL